MKRVLSLILVVVLAAGLFVGCSNDEPKEDTNNTTTDTKEESTEVRTLEIWAEEEYADFFEQVIPAFEEAYNAEVNYVEKGMFDTIDGIALDGPAGIGPDVMAIPHDRIGNLALEGHISPINVTDEEMAGYLDTAKNAIAYEDEVYAMPFSLETTFLIYNKDLIAEAPETYADLEELAKDPQFDNNGDGSLAFLAKYTDFYMVYGIFGGYDAYVFGEDNSNPADIGLNNEGAVEAAGYINKWYSEYFPAGMKDDASAYDIMMGNFLEGNTAAIVNGPWALQDIKNAGINYGVAMLPELPNGKRPAPFSGTQGWAVTSYSEEQELATEFVKFITNEANSIVMAETTSKIPPHNAYVESDAAVNNEVVTTIIEQYSNSTPMPKIVQMAEVWSPMANAIGIIATGQADVETALDEAVSNISQQIEAVHGAN